MWKILLKIKKIVFKWKVSHYYKIMDKCSNLLYVILFIVYLKILTVVNCAIIGMMSPIGKMMIGKIK